MEVRSILFYFKDIGGFSVTDLHEVKMPTTVSPASVMIYRRANEGFMNYDQSSHVVHEEEKSVNGCFAFAYQVVEDALSYNKEYLQKNEHLVDRTMNNEHTILLPHDFPVIARKTDDTRMYYDSELDTLTLFTEDDVWMDTTLGFVFERWKHVQNELAAFKNKHHLPESKSPVFFRAYRWLEVIVDAEQVKQMFSLLETA